MKTHTHHADAPSHEEKHEEATTSFSPIMSPPQSETHAQEDLRTLIEKNIKWAQVIYNQNRKIQRRLSWMVFASYFKLFLILVPVILAIIYLPPLISDFWSTYGSVLGSSGQTFQEYFQLLKSAR